MGRYNIQRCSRGSMLILITAFIVGIVMALLLFSLGFVRLLGTNAEQRTAIEAAALAAARDCSAIVVPTTEVGWVSLSDYAPVGSTTNAPDGFPLPVRSINTLIGTARLDLIIADALNKDIMRQLSRMDMDDALIAKGKLETVLNAALLPGGTGQDINGNTITPYQSAEDAYKQNQIRMTGATSYKAGSLQLTLGSIEGGGPTAIPVPEPQAMAPVAANHRFNDNYKSYVNIPFTAAGVTTDFVFGGVGSSLRIVDHKKFSTNINGLPYQIPTIIKAEAIQIIDNDEIKAAACAQPASINDPLPAPGALSLSCPDGQVPELTRLGDIWNESDLNDAGSQGADMLTAVNGDFPTDTGSSMNPMGWPLDGTSTINKSTAQVWQVGLHDWIRRAGTKARISAVVNLMNQAFLPPPNPTVNWLVALSPGGPQENLGPIPGGLIHVWNWRNNGTIQYQVRPLTPLPLYVSSNRQMYAETMIAINESGIGTVDVDIPNTGGKKLHMMSAWDAYIRDEVRNRGVPDGGSVPPPPAPGFPYNTFGGKHAGEPLGKPAVAYFDKLQSTMIASNQEKPVFAITGYGAGSGGGSSSGSGSGSGGSTTGSDGHGKGKGFGSSGVTGGKDTGYPPFLYPQDDFADGYGPTPPFISPMPTGSGVRPFYQTIGTAVDLKFRRQVNASQFVSWDYQIGYVGDVGQILP